MLDLNREAAAALYAAYEEALRVLSEAEAVLWNLPEHPDREKFIDAHTDVVIGILSRLRAPLVLRYRELDTQRPDGPPDTQLDDEERVKVSQLTESEISLIDDVLLADCATSYRKVARVVATAMTGGADRQSGVPVAFLAQRVKALVESGKLESQGNLDYMRFSEVRLPS